MTRREAILKVTGAARYAADNHPPGMLHAVLAVSRIARGRVTFLDVEAARRHPGVIEIMTPENRPALAQDPDAKTNPFMFRLDLLQNDGVRYVNQPIAVVIAETLEAATEGAALLSPRYEAQPARVGLDGGERFVPPAVGVGNPSAMRRGDVEAGLATAATRIDATYQTPTQYHNAMEPHAIVAAWDGDSLSIDTPSQGLAMAQGRIAGLFGIAPGPDPNSQSLPWGRLRLEGLYLGAAGAWHPGRPAGRPAGQAGAAPRTDVRACRPSCADAAAVADRRRRRWAVDCNRSSGPAVVEQLRRLLRTGRRHLAYALRQPRHRPPRMKRSGSIPARRCSCGPPARRPDRSRWRVRSTKRPSCLRPGSARLSPQELR